MPGSARGNVYELAVKAITPGESYTATGRQPFTAATTRRHYPGDHAPELRR